MSSKLETFFIDAKDDLEKVGSDIKKVFVALFGQQALTSLENTAEEILNGDFGQAVLEAAQNLYSQVQSGKLSMASALAQLAASVVSDAKSAGVTLANDISLIVSSLAISKLQGVLSGSSTSSTTPTGPGPQNPPTPISTTGTPVASTSAT